MRKIVSLRSAAAQEAIAGLKKGGPKATPCDVVWVHTLDQKILVSEILKVRPGSEYHSRGCVAVELKLTSRTASAL
ncbi:hypothetical protein M2308_001952 [Rhizobium leguminosarum]|nr:hypothetical protein [Rhizobium leguminosarum]